MNPIYIAPCIVAAYAFGMSVTKWLMDYRIMVDHMGSQRPLGPHIKAANAHGIYYTSLAFWPIILVVVVFTHIMPMMWENSKRLLGAISDKGKGIPITEFYEEMYQKLT